MWHTHGHITRCDRYPITTQALIIQRVIHSRLDTNSYFRHTISGNQGKGIFNVYIHRRHHYTHHQLSNFGEAIQKIGTTGDPYHVPDPPDLRDPQSKRTPLGPQTIRGRAPYISQDMSGMVHPNTILKGISSQVKGVFLGKWQQGVHILNKNRKIQAGIPHRKSRPCHTNNPTNRVLSYKTIPFSKQGK